MAGLPGGEIEAVETVIQKSIYPTKRKEKEKYP
jgi:hypothetical protein